MVNLISQTNAIDHRRVVSTDEIISPKYNIYLCFLVKVRTTSFVYVTLEKHTPQQEEIYQKIQSLQKSGLGYRKILDYLNDKVCLTNKGKKWSVNNVYSVFKRHIEKINRPYELAFDDWYYRDI